MPTLSKLSDKCEKCKHVNDCDEKRMVACAIAELPPSRLENAARPLSAPIARENTTIEEINKRIEKNLYKQLYCGFNRKL